MESQNKEKILQTVDDFAQSIGVTSETVRIWIRRNKVPSFKIGKRRFVNVRKLDELIKESEKA